MDTKPSIEQQVTFIYVSDLTRSADFYAGRLGLPLVLDQGSCRIYAVTSTAFIGLCQAGNRPVNREGVILTLATQEVDAWHAYLTAQGVSVEKPPVYNPTYDIYHLFVRDPDGYLIEFQTFRDPAWPSP
jgi:catechol 2,3-dioxygenase-like lactoylglutathione lyase family enzyme